ncbi:MAG: type II toxin-antitoxin system VapC family toxin [Thermoleophilaceae bacterium]
MIFVDSNVPMYLVGAPHPHKVDSQRLVESALTAGERLVTDAEVLQEICHRYTAVQRLDMIQLAFDALLETVDEVMPIDRAVAEGAKDIVLRYTTLSARDAIHLAAMAEHGIDRIMTFDRGFDAYPGIERVA